MTGHPRTIEAGERYGRLTVTATRLPSQTHVVCLCDCGTAHRLLARNWGRTRSCGCLNREVAARRATIHGRAGSPEHNTWSSMIQRCTNPRYKQWDDYGGRGITVCDRWMIFANFFADMGPRPPGLTLDRIDNAANYTPGNCRWATWTEQANNKRPHKKWGRRVLLTCAGCGVDFTKLASHVRTQRPCCSQRCRALAGTYGTAGSTHDPEDAAA